MSSAAELDDEKRNPFDLMFVREHRDLLAALEAGEYVDGDVYRACGWVVSEHRRFGLARRPPGYSHWQSAGHPTTSVDDALALFKADYQLRALGEATESYIRYCKHPFESIRIAQALCAVAVMHPEWRGEV